MAPLPKSARLNALIDKGRRLFRNGSAPDLPTNLHDSTTNVPLTSSSPTTSQKKFKKSNDVRHDIRVLAMTYILQDNPTIQELIRLIICLNDYDNGSKHSGIVALSATFILQLTSFHEEDSSRALTAITAFLTTMQLIDAMVRNGIETGDIMIDMINDSIKQIKDTHPTLDYPNWNIGGCNDFSSILDTMIGTSSTILNVFNQASSVIPVPFVKPLVASVASLLTAVQQTRSNHDDMKQVATVAGEFVVILAITCTEDEMKPSPTFKQALGRLEKKLHDIAQKCSELSRHNVLWRFFNQGVDQNSLSGIKQDLHNAVIQFQTDAQLLQHLDLRSLGQVLNGKLDEDAVNALPRPLSYVGRRDEYLPGSRSDVIQVIVEWLENSNQLTFWMRGGAGLGKSTLAHKIVDFLRANGRLATFAFLLRGSSSDPATVIQTMARELSAVHPRAIPQVAAAARACNSSHLPLRDYMESYLLNPIRSLSYPYPLVIVVDALDEWEHYEAFLKELEYIPQSSPVKILLISRTNHSIERSLLNAPVQKYDLLPVSQDITEAYFNHHFAKMDWEMRRPSPIIISNLARLADGQLIWAAMVCSFLSYEMRAGAPHELLDQILSSGKQIALEGQLSNLYHDALRQLFRDDKDQKLFQQVFGAMTVLQKSIPLHDFARLLGLSHYQVRGVQFRLTALQTRGIFDELTVHPASEHFHSSFIEFTMNSGEAEAGNSYLINPQTAHESMAEGCLSFLSGFLSSFRGRECSHSDLRGIESYAVEFWPLHVANSNGRLTPLSPNLESLILDLPEMSLRKWGSWFLAISLPTSSQNWDQVLGPIEKDGFYSSLAGFLQDNVTTDTTHAWRITCCLEIAVRSQPKRQKAWEDLGDSYRKRFDSTGTLDLLNNAIIVFRHTLELCSRDGSPLISMSSLASALRGRFGRTGSMVDLNEGISIGRELLLLCPTPHSDRSASLTNLGLGLSDRFERIGSKTDLEEAILMYRESVSLCPSPGPARCSSLNNLGTGLVRRFAKMGSVTDLEEAILILRESLSYCSTPHPLRSISLSNLSYALVSRFDATGSMPDLDEAILMRRECLSLRPILHPHRSVSLNNLAAALQIHHRTTGSMTTLDEAILLHRESLFLRPIPHPLRASSLNNMADALHYRARKTGSIPDLDEAISMHREAISLLPSTHLDRLVALKNFVYTLETRFNKTGVQIDSDELTSLRQEILAMSK